MLQVQALCALVLPAVKIHFTKKFVEQTQIEDHLMETQDCSCVMCATGEYLCTTTPLSPEHASMSRHSKFYHVHHSNAEKVSNCDGCARGLAVVDGLHRDPERSWDSQGCTADRYAVVPDVS
jgi:hypothetical protein